MKVLFVFRGIGKDLRNSVIDAQITSFKNLDVEILKYPINLGGFKGYLKAITGLKRFLNANSVDLIHAHYGYSGFVSYLCSPSNTICSLMGSDIYSQNYIIKRLTLFFSKYLWRKTIVKSERMHSLVPESIVIPNGVNFKTFYPLDKVIASNQTEFDINKINIIFIAEDINSYEKNYILAKKAIEIINDSSIALIPVSGKQQSELKYFYSSANLLLMTSLSEGSPNVIKEAMACNCPIVATDVGDIKEVISKTEGCYVTTFDPEDVANKILLSIKFGGRTNGREHIIHLESKTIAKKIIDVYKQVIEIK